MSADQDHEDAPSSPDIHFEPIVTLAKVEIKTLEEDEEEMFRMRAKLFRYIIGQHDTKPEWKERGIGDVKILKHKAKHVYRLVMRREKTLKVCANHLLNKDMELRPNCGSDRAWVWNVPADFAEEEPQKETLAIRFANAENAKKFKEVFDKCKDNIPAKNDDVESDKLASELESLKVKDETEQQTRCNGESEPTKDENTETTNETEGVPETKEGDTQKDDPQAESQESVTDKPTETVEDSSQQHSE